MDTYNGVAGIDEQALGVIVSNLYLCARDHIFRRVVSVEDRGFPPLTAVEYDVTTEPRVGFAPAATPPADGSTTSSFHLRVDQFVVTLHYSGGLPPTALVGSLDARADLVSDPAGSALVTRLTGATLNLEGEEKLSEIFNNVVGPHLDRFLQEILLDPIRVPALRAGGLTLNGPAVASSEDRLLISTAVAPNLAATAPLNGGWPTGEVFVAADFALVNQLAAEVLPEIGTKSGEWSKTVKVAFGLGHSTIKATYSAQVAKLTLAPVAGQPNRIEGSATINATLHAWAKNLFDVSGTSTAAATVTAEFVANEHGGVGVRLTGLKPFSLRFSLSGPAKGFGLYAQTIANAASGALRDAISGALATSPLLAVGTLPRIDVPVENRVYTVQIRKPAVRTIQVGGRAFLVAAAVPEVQLRNPARSSEVDTPNPESAARGYAPHI